MSRSFDYQAIFCVLFKILFVEIYIAKLFYLFYICNVNVKAL